MEGIGKTTLAKVIFNRLSSCFGKCCFLEDVRGKSSKANGLVDLQKKLLSEIGHLQVIRSIDEIEYGMERIGEMLCNKKVLIVLDDIDDSEQVEKLVGKSALYSGSRILITTRDKDVLPKFMKKYHIVDYEMVMMSTYHALKLFNRCAFDGGSHLDDYNDLSRAIVYSTGGLPLALEVIGKYLHDKSQEMWKETLDELREAPHDDVFRKLKISYDALSFKEQQIFLDIACFFVGEDKTNAFYMWKDCKYSPETRVDVLISRSLVKIVASNKFWMHDQLRDLGKQIVHLENIRIPKDRSRIWIREEVLEAIKTEKISEKVQALYLDESVCNSHDVVVQSKEIGRFEYLRFLKLSQLSLVGDIDLTKLRWISLVEIYKWTNIRLENVVVLELSKVEFLDDLRLQNLTKMTRKLKVLSLQDCHNITRTPDFFECPNLERLTFQRCSKLMNIDGSIGKLNNLIDLKIQSCHSVKHLSEDIGDLVNLQCFFVEATKVDKLPDSIWKLKSLHEVHLLDKSGQSYGWQIYFNLNELFEDLDVLEIKNCNLKGLLPLEVRGLHFLRILNPSYTPVYEVLETSIMRPPLQRIELMQCHWIQELPTLPTSLTHLSVASSLLRVVPNLSNLTNLVELTLCVCGREGDELCTSQLRWIGRLSKLTKLKISLPQVPVPTELASLRRLNKLDLFGLDMQTFQDLRNLSVQRLFLRSYPETSPSQDLRNLSSLMLGGSPMQELQLDGLQLPQLKELHVKCQELLRLRLSRMSELKDVMVDFSPKLVEVQLSWVFKSLEKLSIVCCDSFERLVYETNDVLSSPEGRLIFPLRVLNKLRDLKLVGCHKILDIQVVGTSESWKYIYLDNCSDLQSLGGLSNLKNLKTLDIKNCDSLRVVEGVDELESLDHLWLHHCASLERLIDVSTTKLPNDCNSWITDCKKLRGFENEF
ncbi:hypothetical protein BT93_L2420 [Corymbia citriodora subsp. variegata]|uniref:NB-ARC domain-containing protein n=1 Tax=Corymbia citriodora subsp. variegata TaxID=360336 RepID=A0A8T0CK37_CORYI|nr:hypothetical protein BT93_L2420 [Corymbia citriodora subsp. variegata]